MTSDMTATKGKPVSEKGFGKFKGPYKGKPSSEWDTRSKGGDCGSSKGKSKSTGTRPEPLVDQGAPSSSTEQFKGKGEKQFKGKGKTVVGLDVKGAKGEPPSASPSLTPLAKGKGKHAAGVSVTPSPVDPAKGKGQVKGVVKGKEMVKGKDMLGKGVGKVGDTMKGSTMEKGDGKATVPVKEGKLTAVKGVGKPGKGLKDSEKGSKGVGKDWFPFVGNVDVICKFSRYIAMKPYMI